MLDSSIILSKVRQGLHPQGWHVFHMSKSFPLRRGMLVGVITLCLTFIACIFLRKQLQIPNTFLFTVPLGSALLWGTLCGLHAFWLTRISVLVITPHGFIQQTGTSAQSLVVVSYSDLTRMEIEVNVQSRNGYTCQPRVATHGEATTLRLKLLYPDGTSRVWSPDKRFGASTEVAPYINEGYVRYFAFKKKIQSKPYSRA